MNSHDSDQTDAARSVGSVLLVDDEPALLEIFAAVLGRHFEISTAASAREADLLLRAKPFMVIVADHTMPGETGLSFLARAAASYPQVQRVLVTGNMTPEMRAHAADLDLLFAFMEKPVSLDHFVKVVQSAARAHDAALAAAK
jgi:DNA-binding NtrC family response regulator